MVQCLHFFLVVVVGFLFKYVKDVKVWGISDAFEFPTIMCFVFEFGLDLLDLLYYSNRSI